MALLPTATAVGVVNILNLGEGFLMLTPLLPLSSVVLWQAVGALRENWWRIGDPNVLV